MPIRIFIFTPFIGTTAIVVLRSADDDAAMLATRLHQQVAENIRMRLDDYLERSPAPIDARSDGTLASLLRSQAVGTNGRAFILDRTGKMIALSAPGGDPVVESAVAALARHTGPSDLSAAATGFKFDHVTAKPLSRQTWLTYATAYRNEGAGRHWILVTVMPEASYLGGLARGQQSCSAGVRPSAGALPRAGSSAGGNSGHAAATYGAGDTNDGCGRSEHTVTRQQTGGAGCPREIIQRHGGQTQDVV